MVGRTGTLGVHYTVTNVTGRTAGRHLRRRHRRPQDGVRADRRPDDRPAGHHPAVDVHRRPVRRGRHRRQTATAASRLTFQMTLFPPIGSDTAEFGYTAHVSPGLVPPANLTSMAVSPLDYPSFKDGSASYQAGAQKGVDLTGGALQIDDSVLKLHDGAAQLLAGLLQLHDGANQLSTGLNDEPHPAPPRSPPASATSAAPEPPSSPQASTTSSPPAPSSSSTASPRTRPRVPARPGARRAASWTSATRARLPRRRLADAPRRHREGRLRVSTHVDAGLAQLYDTVALPARSAPRRPPTPASRSCRRRSARTTSAGHAARGGPCCSRRRRRRSATTAGSIAERTSATEATNARARWRPALTDAGTARRARQIAGGIASASTADSLAAHRRDLATSLAALGNALGAAAVRPDGRSGDLPS